MWRRGPAGRCAGPLPKSDVRGLIVPVPILLVTGFLGAGKTTVVNHLLAHAEGRPVADKKSPALYRKHAEKMHQIIALKYRANDFDALKRIVISPSDLEISRWQSANLSELENRRSSADIESSAA